MSVKVKINTSALKKFQNKVEALNNQVSFNDLFTPQFMSKYTNYTSFDELLVAGGYIVNSPDDFKAIPDDEFDSHIANTTKFSSWEDMKNVATKEYVQRQLS